ncbi:lipopolysaccharide heptosyltransferase I [Ostreibacterium oceani]|uniref:Lipopolysaccharide heptosyltransferase 1 n=1 Tax=Ostreibacterium oceani TaxID=2654998 RepID=A0A6N7EVS0_9GAMM|nr:lipopolysaccharide heptosyltransferase I [Ostreibacterium oceani]MPV86651.1 lipopolysaccharide heptosyltransferase I [Ostreibacterium oceani]
MRVLLVKTSSLGDVVHTLTPLSVLKQQRPELRIDWLVESGFADIAALAQAQGDIENVIEVNFRAWRREKPVGFFWHPELKQLKAHLRQQHYDLVIDAQGLLKSAYLAKLAGAPISGFDKASAREPLATVFYQRGYAVERRQQAVYRLQKLFAQIFDYPPVLDMPPVSLEKTPSVIFDKRVDKRPTALIFHGTTWDNKRYPDAHWKTLIAKLSNQFDVQVAHGNEEEKQRAEALVSECQHAHVLPACTLAEMMARIQAADAVISVDTGLAHMADYFGVPAVALFGPTNPRLTGLIRQSSQNLTGLVACAPCMQRQCYKPESGFAPCLWEITPERVLAALKIAMENSRENSR